MSSKLHHQTRKLSDLKPAIEIYHFYTGKQRSIIENSLRKHRQFSPIVIDQDDNILSGYLIYRAMKKLGLKTATVIKLS